MQCGGWVLEDTQKPSLLAASCLERDHSHNWETLAT